MTSNDTYCSNRINFLNVNTATELRNFLQKVSLKHPFFHHITTVNALMNILKTGLWRLSSGDKTNDLQELYEKGALGERHRIFTTSFSHGDGECIGMWKVYLKQEEPNNQICLSFPKKNIEKWLISLKHSMVCYIQADNNEESEIRLDDISFHDIAYAYGIQNDKNARLCWGNIVKKYTKCNQVDVSQVPLLTGFIKNSAWEYEKESRLMVKISSAIADSSNGHIFVPYPLELWNKVKITFGPFAQGDVLADFNRKIHNAQLGTYTELWEPPQMSYFQGKIHM